MCSVRLFLFGVEMKRTYPLFVAALILVVAGCNISINGSSTGVRGSGTKKSEDREVESFSKVVIEGIGDVDISMGDEPSLTIATDDNLLELIESTVADGVLTIKPTEEISPTDDLEISITTTACEAVTVDGAAAIEFIDATGESLDIVINGAGSVSGSGEIDSLDVETNGAGNVELGELKAKSVTIVMSGAGNGTVYASESVDGTINGVGSITVAGSPAEVKRSINGLGTFNVEGE